VVVRMRFTDFTGKFVFHCHILNHEDNGMMAVIEVVP
jgi:FtsP/CotA-like multicopper oxidase with cupredoxin domain